MKDTMNDEMQILALIPHRDAMPEMRQAKKDLFCEGLYGVFSFPFVAPLALLKRPLKFDELKIIAKDLRTQTLTKNGRFTGEMQETIPLFDDYSAYGVRLSVPVPEVEGDAIVHCFEKVVLTQALIKKGYGERGAGNREDFSSTVSFRAAAVANVTLRSLGMPYSFEWTIGRPVWLPKGEDGSLQETATRGGAHNIF